MFKKVLLGFLMVGMILLVPAYLVAQDKIASPDQILTVTQPGGAGTQYQLNESGGPPANALIINLTLKRGQCERIKFANATLANVTARNTTAPVAKPLKPDVTAAPGANSAPHEFCCDGDAGQWVFEVGDGIGGAPDAILTVNVTCAGAIPSLTFYGLIALALLLAGTAVWMFRKRRVSVA